MSPRWFLLGTALIGLQLLIAYDDAASTCRAGDSDFPLAHGKLWPDMSAEAVAGYNQRRVEVLDANPITTFQIGQMAHRIVAILSWWWSPVARGKRGPRAAVQRWFGLFWLGLILVQVGLGAWTIWSNKAADVATAHVVVGALSLVTGAWLPYHFAPFDRNPVQRRSLFKTVMPERSVG